LDLEARSDKCMSGVLVLCTTPTTIWASSFDASCANLGNPKLSPRQTTSSLALCFMCSELKSRMTRAFSRDASVRLSRSRLGYGFRSSSQLLTARYQLAAQPDDESP